MIELVGKPGDLNCRIKFTPRPGFKQTHTTIERELMYGHYCPSCMNVVQALFLTDDPISLWPYEETNVMSTSKDEAKIGTILRIVPHVESKRGHSAYTTTSLRSVGSPGQHIVLKNHVLKYHGLKETTPTPDRFFEPGDRTCEYTGVFALREDLLVRDICLLMQMSAHEVKLYNIPSLADFMTTAMTYDIRLLPAYGSALPIIVVAREKIADRWGGYTYQVRNALKPYLKSLTPTVAE